MSDFADQERDGQEQPRLTAAKNGVIFQHERWSGRGPEAVEFFDRFVPAQYDNGFCWRCHAIAQGEEARIVAFEDQSEQIQEIIAHNADLLLELYESYPPEVLDAMRLAGREFVDVELPLDLTRSIAGDVPALSERMGRDHHEGWLEQYHSDVQQGKREAGHRGALPFDELPPIEKSVLKVQALANWRILALLEEADYERLRDVSHWKHFGSSLDAYDL